MKNYYIILICTFLWQSVDISYAQKPQSPTSQEILLGIQKARFLGSVLYVAAHPDDENTSMISYLANHKHARTAYLSLTRGDGGQNLIGNELGNKLGIIRTQELMAARRVDRGIQFFSTALDFGYSKTPDETLTFWEEEQVLSDMIRVVRQFRPDVIINRFDHNSAGRTHGHHTTSALMSYKAFDMYNQKDTFAKILNNTIPWQPSRLLLNTSWWFYGSKDKFAELDKSKFIAVDVGVYYPLLGYSNTEIAAISRSQHACQGMGRALVRGSQMEYLQLLKGIPFKSNDDIFEGINTTWSRLRGGEKVDKILTEVEKKFNPQKPYLSVKGLIESLKTIDTLEDTYWTSVKRIEIIMLIKACLGLFLEAVADAPTKVRGELIELDLEMVCRSPFENIELLGYKLSFVDAKVSINEKIEYNRKYQWHQNQNIATNAPLTEPYWTKNSATKGHFVVKDKNLIGLPETPKHYQVVWDFLIEGYPIEYQTPLIYKSVDAVKGELYRPFEIVPKVSIGLDKEVIVSTTDDAQTIVCEIVSEVNLGSGQLEVITNGSWETKQKNVSVYNLKAGEPQRVEISVFSKSKSAEGVLNVAFKTMEGMIYNREKIIIAYDHIPTQIMYEQPSTKLVKLELKLSGRTNKVAYINGAGDKVAEALRVMGYDVDVFEPYQLSNVTLNQYDAVLVGIRAYNVSEDIGNYIPKIWKYAKSGGNLIIQYQTPHRLKIDPDMVLPGGAKITRQRVSNENAEVKFLDPKHNILNYPNQITKFDFDNWVQERGLYFARDWQEAGYEAILSWSDKGEKAQLGGLIFLDYGEGNVVYTGISFFRQLPAGVPGAYRLMANLIEIE